MIAFPSPPSSPWTDPTGRIWEYSATKNRWRRQSADPLLLTQPGIVSAISNPATFIAALGAASVDHGHPAITIGHTDPNEMILRLTGGLSSEGSPLESLVFPRELQRVTYEGYRAWFTSSLPYPTDWFVSWVSDHWELIDYSTGAKFHAYTDVDTPNLIPTEDWVAIAEPGVRVYVGKPVFAPDLYPLVGSYPGQLLRAGVGAPFSWYQWNGETWDRCVATRNDLGLAATDAPTFAGLNLAGPLRLTDTVWDDLRFPAQAINPAGAANPPTISSSTGMLEFAGNADNVIAGQAQLPHSWAEGTALRPHLHLIFPTANSNTSRWKLEYAIFPLTGTGPTYGNYTALPAVSQVNPNVANSLRILSLGDIPMTGQLGSCTILWRISRLALSDGADNDTSNVVMTEFDIHFQINKLGSDDEIPS